MKKQNPSQQGKKPTPSESERGAGSNQFLIVGIGASAGGIEAAKEFFLHVPEDSGMAYVVILHLSPEHESHLAQVLQQTAKIPVTQVTERVRVEPNRVYVIPPSQHLQMADVFLTLTPNINFEERRAPVDIFFRTLAEAHEARAVAVILSGTGANGSMGIKRIKEKGGVAFVQSPQEAQFNEMPRNSIATELIDDVLPVAEIPAKIIAYRNSLGTVESPGDPEQRPDEQQALFQILLHLRLKTGHDFANYKLPTLLRRIERRMHVRSISSLPGYAEFIKEYPDELQALLKDLLISVTNFYRDAEAFEAIEKEILPEIIKGKKAGDQVRIWIAGCATGEEAYSIAMQCTEILMSIPGAPQVQIFATDIDEAALTIAREGVYTMNDAADVSPERLRRFFNKQGNDYHIRSEIRDMILFAHHNILKDPPFSHLHLASCRNLLIYLNKQALQQVMETLHFALNPGGYLFLGSAESVESTSDLYATVSREHHIYQTRGLHARVMPVTDGFPTLRSQLTGEKQTGQEREKKLQQPVFSSDLHRQLLEQYAPPSLIVDENFDVVHVSEGAGGFMQLSGGEPSANVLKLIRPELRLELRSALYNAVQQRTNVQTKPLHVRVHEKEQTVSIHVRPVLRPSNTARGFLLIIFEPEKPIGEEEPKIFTVDESVASQLEKELLRTKEQLRSLKEDHALQSEESKAANDEQQVLNEELRAAAEELETSKEELQSMNEELRTVNQELKIKIEEITHTSNNLQNLINSTHIGTIFLDRSFKVILFTPTAREIYNLIPADIGRSLTDITSKLANDGVIADAERVLEKLQPIEREVLTVDNKSYTMRLLPYLTSEDHIKGVVITFYDVTKSRQVEKALRETEDNYRLKLEQEIDDRTSELKQSRDQYSSLAENTPDVITRWNKDLKLMYANSAFERKTGVPNENLLGKNNSEMGQPDEIALPYMNSLRKAFETGEIIEHFNAYQTPEGEAQFYSRIVPEKNEKGEVKTLLATARDITALKKAEQEVLRLKDEAAQRAEDKYRVLFNSIDEGFGIFELMYDDSGKAFDYRYLEVNQAFERQTGLVNAPGKLGSEIVPHTESYWLETYDEVLKTGKPQRIENYNRSTGRWYNSYASRIGGAGSCQVCTVFNDVTERKQHERQQAFLLKLNDALRSLTDPAKLQHEAMRLLGEHLGITRAQYYEARPDDEYLLSSGDYTNGAPPAMQRVRMDDLGPCIKEAFRAGRLLAIADVSVDASLSGEERAACDALGFRACVGIPLVKAGRFVAGLGLHHSTRRDWTGGEISIAGDTAERTWAAVERVRAEEALRKSEEQKSFMLRVSDALHSLSNAVEIQETVTNIALQYFDADRCYYCEIEDDIATIRHDAFKQGLSSVAAVYLMSKMPILKAMSQTGRPLVVTDVYTTDIIDENVKQLCISVNILAFISVPVTKNGELEGNFCITQSAVRNWSDKEVETAKEIAERTWASIERAKAEEASRDSEARLQLSIKTAGLFTWEVNTQTGETRYSDNYREVLGFKISKISYENYLNIYADDKDFVLEAVDKALQGEAPLDVEHRIVHPHTGETIWVKAQGSLIQRNTDVNPVLIGITQNITARKLVEEALKKNGQLLRHIIRNLPGGSINVFDKDLRYIFAEGQGLKDVGLTSEQLTGKTLAEVFSAEGVKQVLPHYLKTFEGETTQFELAVSGHWYALYTAPLKDASGSINTIIVLAQNITDRKNLEQQREDFISIASHELKTPVTSIKAYTELLQETCSEGDYETGASLVKKLGVQVDHLIELVHDLLDVTKMAEGELPLKLQPFDLKLLAEEKAEELQRLSSVHPILIQPKEATIITADRERIGQVLTNFISNAIKYSPKGGDVTINWKQTNSGTEVSVQDKGIGIPEEMQSKIFDRFFRVKDVALSNYPGMGLGLYITADIVHRHGGELWVESKPGQGSIFYFFLPEQPVKAPL